MTNQNIVIVDATRTAIGAFNGGLSTVSAANLGAKVIDSLIQRNNITAGDIDQVIMGQVLTANTGQNPARQAAINAGLPQESTAMTINQVCGSGLRAVMLAAQQIKTGDANIIIAGGQENMSMAPHAAHLRNGIKMGDGTMVDTMILDALTDAFTDIHMGITAENIAEKYGISRQEQDEFAFNSQQKCAKAQEAGKFADEITPVTVKTRKAEIIIDKDEHPKADTALEKLASLRAAFKKDGTVTAGNASGINDGAAALLVMSEEEANKRNLTPLAHITSYATCGVDPNIMGTGPIPSSRKALELAGWSASDLDLIEANEAFAAQAIAVNKDLGWDTNKVNISGGAIALGHPVGASGARVLTTLLYGLKRDGLHKGLATLCIGGGMGVAMCVERR